MLQAFGRVGGPVLAPYGRAMAVATGASRRMNCGGGLEGVPSADRPAYLDLPGDWVITRKVPSKVVGGRYRRRRSNLGPRQRPG